MHIANINEAKTHLSQLIKRALAGDEVVIARANEPLVRLEPIFRDTRPRVGGQWAGQVVFHGSWEDADREVAELFEGSISKSEVE